MEMKLKYVALILGLAGLSGCSDELPSCKSREAKNRVEKLINDYRYSHGEFVKLNSISEIAYQEGDHQLNERRICKGHLTTTTSSKDIFYYLYQSWRDKEQGIYHISINTNGDLRL